MFSGFENFRLKVIQVYDSVLFNFDVVYFVYEEITRANHELDSSGLVYCFVLL